MELKDGYFEGIGGLRCHLCFKKITPLTNAFALLLQSACMEIKHLELLCVQSLKIISKESNF